VREVKVGKDAYGEQAFRVKHPYVERTTPMKLIEQIISAIEHWQKYSLTSSQQDQCSSMAVMEQAAQSPGLRIAQQALSHIESH
jgi:hypothetical protein